MNKIKDILDEVSLKTKQLNYLIYFAILGHFQELHSTEV